MNHAASAVARRDVLRSVGGLIALLAGSSLLGGCGGEEATSASEPVAVVPGAGTPATGAAAPLVVAKPETSWMNFALAVQYIGAQFYTIAATGSGMPSTLQSGVGVQGSLRGGRQVVFADPYLGQYAKEFAADQVSTVTTMRAALGTSTGAQPTIDFSSDAFGTIGRATNLGSGFDPFAGDTGFLFGALILEHAVAGAYRAMLTAGVVDDAGGSLTKAMGDSIYRDGLIRAMLATKAQDDSALTDTISSVFTALTKLEASTATLEEPQIIGQASSSVSDGDGHPIALTRSAGEVFRLLYLNSNGISGGLLPTGVNGVDLLPGLQ
jgi:hypothetical protein